MFSAWPPDLGVLHCVAISFKFMVSEARLAFAGFIIVFLHSHCGQPLNSLVEPGIFDTKSFQTLLDLRANFSTLESLKLKPDR